MDGIIKIPWSVGGGNIIVSANGGDVTISSDSGFDKERSQTLTFTTDDNRATASLTVTQRPLTVSDVACFSTGVWQADKPWIMDMKWNNESCFSAGQWDEGRHWSDDMEWNNNKEK